jgi:hypothetical protein
MHKGKYRYNNFFRPEKIYTNKSGSGFCLLLQASTEEALSRVAGRVYNDCITGLKFGHRRAG